MSGEIWYVFVAEVPRSVGYLKARRLVRELTGKPYNLTGIMTPDVFRFAVNRKYLFDLTTLKRKVIDDELILVIGRLKTEVARLSSMGVIPEITANESLRLIAKHPESNLEEMQKVEK